MKLFFYGLVAVIGFALILVVPNVGAADAVAEACKVDPAASICGGVNDPTTDFNSIVGVIVDTLLYIVGALSVLMLIVGAIMYITSAGDSARVTKAKNTIVAAVVGLVLAFLAYAIVTYVVDLF